MAVPSHGIGCKTKTYPTTCPECEQDVFFFSCTCGSRVFFDCIEPEYIEHFCWDFDAFVKANHTYDELVEQGIVALKRGDIAQAVWCFGKGTIINSRSSDSWIRLSNVLHMRSEQLFCLNQALSLTPHNKLLTRSIQKYKDVKPSTPLALHLLWQEFKRQNNIIIYTQLRTTNHVVPTDKVFKCKFCKTNFSKKKDLRAHIFKFHLNK